MASLVIQTSFLGDMVLTTPLLERLAERGPVDVVATPANAPLLEGHPAVRDVILFDKRGEAKGWRGIKRLASEIRWRDANGTRELRGTRVAYLAQGSVRSVWLAIVSGIPERVGFNTSAARLFYTRRVVYRRDLHHATRLWQLGNLTANEVPSGPLRPSLYPSASDIATVDTLLGANGVRPNEPLIALAPGSVWATKRWPSFDALGAEIAGRAALTSCRVVIIGTAGDSALAAAIVDKVSSAGGPTPVDATGRLSLLASANLIARSVAIVSNDSAPLHLASAMGTPTIALFGPTVPTLGFGPLAPQNVAMGVDHLLCRPCHAHGPQQCPLGHWKCMRELTPEHVGDSLDELLHPPA